MAAMEGARGPHRRGGSKLSGAGGEAESGGSSESHTRRDECCEGHSQVCTPKAPTPMFTGMFGTTTKRREQPKCPLTTKWTNAWWRTPTMGDPPPSNRKAACHNAGAP